MKLVCLILLVLGVESWLRSFSAGLARQLDVPRWIEREKESYDVWELPCGPA